MVYSVINMDIVNSREIKNRSAIQEDLKAYFNLLNDKYTDILATPITITLGDEWQMLLKRPEESYNIINDIRLYLLQKGIKTYTGIGIGTISTNIYNNTSEMDGEAFIYARQALNNAKVKGNGISSKLNKVYLKCKDVELYHESRALQEVAITSISKGDLIPKVTLNEMINVLIENNEVILNKMTLKQIEAISLYKRYGSYKKIVDNNLATSKSVISQRLNAAEYFVYDNNNRVIKGLLNLYHLKIMEIY